MAPTRPGAVLSLRSSGSGGGGGTSRSPYREMSSTKKMSGTVAGPTDWIDTFAVDRSRPVVGVVKEPET